MNLTFIDAVRLMRDAQRRYFRNRDPQSLADAKRLEREVDAQLTKLSQPQVPQTGKLFEL